MEVRYMLLLAALALVCPFLFGRKRRYRASAYCRMTGNPYRLTMEDKGRFGEYQIYRRLAAYEKKDAGFLFNCYLPKRSGETTEVDVIMLHTSGIYVFESKNYSGRIFGREEERTWVQCLRKGQGSVLKEHFLNPLLQNQTHVAQVRRLLGLREQVPVYSLAVFSDRCTVKKISLSDPDRCVTTWRRLRRAVRKFARRQPDALTREEVETFYGRLYPYTQVSEETRQEHIRNLQRRRKKQGIFRRILAWLLGGCFRKKRCPWCGALLVRRNVRQGPRKGAAFYGCSAYPACRYTRSLEGRP